MYNSGKQARPIIVNLQDESYTIPVDGIYQINNIAICKNPNKNKNDNEIDVSLWLNNQRKFRMNRSLSIVIQPPYIMQLTSLLLTLLVLDIISIMIQIQILTTNSNH